MMNFPPKGSFLNPATLWLLVFGALMVYWIAIGALF